MRAKSKSNNTFVVDVGTSKIAMILAKISDIKDGIEIIDSYCASSVGVKEGIIADPHALRDVVRHCYSHFFRHMNDRRADVYVTLPSSVLTSIPTETRLNIAGHAVTYKEINKMAIEAENNNCKKRNLSAIHSFVYNYSIDGYDGLISPIGMHGNTLVCDTHFVACQDSTILNISGFFENCGISVNQYICGHYAGTCATITEDETKLGVCVIEFGGGVTSISIFHAAHMVYIGYVPYGGMNITNDIAKVFGVKIKDAEKIKNLHANLHDYKQSGQVIIENCETQYDEEITTSLLDDIVRARIEEITMMLFKKCPEEWMRKVSACIVIGGSTKIVGIDELIKKISGIKTRIGKPLKKCSPDDRLEVEYANAMGVLKFVNDQKVRHRKHAMLKSSSAESIFQKIKKIFLE
ncbi:Cell division protein FtsA [Candidatus Fokinia solitaria]|uniref:Cell division protein FtsA n=1 Tax=Candidatus Fokinia solitaria TaxID=1802984 RepID=A0A2U8BRT5_9RICK|nr:cell division protein FtsA [Candidatus Fokinia solitaria]AWD33051.1 Cell division protein FtsA [Candidatus Fokinia solitaria]